MIKLNDDLLQELGLNALPLEEKKRMLAHIYETLEMRVGMKLAQQMTDQQLDEFEQFIKNNDEAGALHWLETKFPHYKEVVSSEFENLKVEIRQVAPQILASASANGQLPPQQQAVPPSQPQSFAPQQPQPPQQPSQWQQPSMPAPQQGNWQAPTPPQPQVPQGQNSYGYGPQPQQFAGPQQPQSPQQPPQQPSPQMPQQHPQQPTNGQPGYQTSQPSMPSPSPAPWEPQDHQQPPQAA
ncbi:MAG TPA: DUF5663 domain-containing protein [Candidatus Saccharimonadales bacterium]|nr:DUF5663 domain-containing protein [Candidatus Saccharimonadales bacterium]